MNNLRYIGAAFMFVAASVADKPTLAIIAATLWLHAVIEDRWPGQDGGA